MVDNGKKFNTVLAGTKIQYTVLAGTSTPLSTLGQNLKYASSISEIDSIIFTDQAAASDIQISTDSSSDNSLIDTSTGLKILHTNKKSISVDYRHFRSRYYLYV